MEEYKRGDRVSLAAILVTQGAYKFYVVSMPSTTLAQTCFVVSREEDPIHGFQRLLDEARADKIADYIDNGVGSVPTAIILSTQPQAKMSYNSKSKTISFDPVEKAFLIIDGQHRVWGFRKARTDIRVPVVIYVDLERIDEAQLFVDINENQQRVPSSLMLDVKGLLERESAEERRCRDLFDLFDSLDSSVLKRHLSRTDQEAGKISRKKFNESVTDVLNTMLPDIDVRTAYEMINAFLAACRTTFRRMDDSLGNAIFRPVIFQGMLRAFPLVANNVRFGHGRFDEGAFEDVLSPLIDNLRKEAVRKPGNSYRNFADLVRDALTHVVFRPSDLRLS